MVPGHPLVAGDGIGKEPSMEEAFGNAYVVYVAGGYGEKRRKENRAERARPTELAGSEEDHKKTEKIERLENRRNVCRNPSTDYKKKKTIPFNPPERERERDRRQLNTLTATSS